MRFTDPRKWHEPWFRKMKPEAKILFLYLWERCDNAGFIPIDDDAVALFTGITVKRIKDSWDTLSDKIVIKDDWVWIRDFPYLQKNTPLNPKNNAHKQIIRLLREQEGRFKDCPEVQRLIAPYEGLPCPSGNGNGNGLGMGNGYSNGSGNGESLQAINQELQECASTKSDI